MTYRLFAAMLINFLVLVTIVGLLYYTYGAETTVDKTSAKHLISLAAAVLLPALFGGFTSVFARKDRNSLADVLTVISQHIRTNADEEQQSETS